MFFNHSETTDQKPATVSVGRVLRSEVAMVVFALTLLIASVVAFGFAPMARGEVGENPTALVQTTVHQVLDILRDRQTPQDLRRRQVIDLVAGHFDFADMARSSMGYHWRQLTPDQQGKFVPLFTAFMEDVYLDKIESYSGQTVHIDSETSDSPGFAQVNTTVLQPNGQQPIRIGYRLKQESDGWKVYDVTVDDISITANYRNQFNRVMNDQGFDGLMSAMRSKQQQLAASLG